jgi:hypothetical protein
MCQYRLAETDEAAYPKPWTALQMIGRWNARKARPLDSVQKVLQKGGVMVRGWK